MTQPGFEVFAADWVGIGKQALNMGVTAMAGYLLKNLLTDNAGKVGGVL
jgi:hypothetical protein